MGTPGNSPLSSALPQPNKKVEEHPSNLVSRSKHDLNYDGNLFVRSLPVCSVQFVNVDLYTLNVAAGLLVVCISFSCKLSGVASSMFGLLWCSMKSHGTSYGAAQHW